MSRAERPEPGGADGISSDDRENKRIVGRLAEEVVNGGNYDLIDEFVAEDFVDHTPLGESMGRDALHGTTEYFRTAFPDFPVTTNRIVAEGDSVVWMSQHGTHEGEFMGFEPTVTRSRRRRWPCFGWRTDGSPSDWLSPTCSG